VDDKRWKAIQTIFAAAGKLEDDKRTAYLDEACGGDDELRREVEELLASESTADLDSIVNRAAADLVTAHEGRRIGPYRVVEVIGRGGMGQVYLAERADKELEQQVAIKVVGWFAVTDSQIDRFLAERQILASLDHPNIARLLDGGRTNDGIPYLAMEYVDGRAIVDYVDDNALSLEARLRLFLKVCDAVQHAHGRLVIHRDIKPSNILVTAEGVPKLLDFGIAKLLDASTLGPQAPLTRADLRVLTPEYASPEQLQGLPVTTQTDVYGLGLLLYQLLTGRFPYAIENVESPRLESIILETEPGLPSAAVTRALPDGGNAGPALPPRQLSRRLQGDLDNIVLMALRKEPERRYQTVKDLADDVRSYLDDRPVRARGESAVYRAQKFLRRNRAAAIATVIVAVAIATQTVFYTQRLAEERDAARLQAARAEEVADFLTDLFAEADPSRNLGAPLTARQMLDRGASRIVDELGGQPALQAALMVTIAQSYENMEENVAAREYLDAAVPGVAARLGPDHPDVLNLRFLQGSVMTFVGDAEASLAIHSDNLQRQLAVHGPGSYEVARETRQLGVANQRLGNYDEAERLYRDALHMFRSLGTAAAGDMAGTLLDYGSMLRRLDRGEEEETMLLEALAVQEARVGRHHPDYAAVVNNLGNHYFRRSELHLAQRYMQEHVDLQRALNGEDSVPYGVALVNYGSLLKEEGEQQAALDRFNEALAIYSKGYGRDAPRYAYLLENIANTLVDLGRYDEAEAAYHESLAILEKRFGRDHPEYAFTQRNLGVSLKRMGRPAEAVPALRAAIATWTKAHGPDYSRVITARTALAESLYDAGDLDAAEVEADAVAAAARNAFPEPGMPRLLALRIAALVKRDLHDYDAADPLFTEAIAVADSIGDRAVDELVTTEIAYARSLAEQQRLTEARALLAKRDAVLGHGADEERLRERVKTALANL